MSFFDGADFHSFLFCWNGSSLYRCYYANMLRAFCLGLRGPEAHQILTDQLGATVSGNLEFEPMAKRIFRMMETIDIEHAFQLLQSIPSRHRAYCIWHHTSAESPISVDISGYIEERIRGNDGATVQMFSKLTCGVYTEAGTSAMYILPLKDIDIDEPGQDADDSDSESESSDEYFIDLESIFGLSSGYQSEQDPWEIDSETSERQRRFLAQFEGNPIISKAPDCDDDSSDMDSQSFHDMNSALDEGGTIENEVGPGVEYGEHAVDQYPTIDLPDEMSRFQRVRKWLEDSDNAGKNIIDSQSDTDLFTSGERKLVDQSGVCPSRSACNLCARPAEIPFQRIKLFQEKRIQDVYHLTLEHTPQAGCSHNNGYAVDTLAKRKRKAPCDDDYDSVRNDTTDEVTNARPRRLKLVRYE